VEAGLLSVDFNPLLPCRVVGVKGWNSHIFDNTLHCIPVLCGNEEKLDLVVFVCIFRTEQNQQGQS